MTFWRKVLTIAKYNGKVKFMLRGTRIITGKEARDYSSLIQSFRIECNLRGFQEVIIPSIWEQKTFVDKAGSEVLNQMYTFKDKKDRDICLIPEVTAIIQEEAKNWKAWSKPIQVFYVSRCYRYERPQAGRYREFTQFGVEILGEGDYTPTLINLARILLSTIPNMIYIVNNSVKRGLDYYTENGFEIEVPILGAQKQVCGGGKYKGGAGFAMGIDRLLLAKNMIDSMYETNSI